MILLMLYNSLDIGSRQRKMVIDYLNALLSFQAFVLIRKEDYIYQNFGQNTTSITNYMQIAVTS